MKIIKEKVLEEFKEWRKTKGRDNKEIYLDEVVEWTLQREKLVREGCEKSKVWFRGMYRPDKQVEQLRDRLSRIEKGIEALPVYHTRELGHAVVRVTEVYLKKDVLKTIKEKV